MRKLGKEQKIELDKIIKDYIGTIRKLRDCMYKNGLLPDQAKVELSTYKPMLWTRRGLRNRGNNRQPINNNY